MRVNAANDLEAKAWPKGTHVMFRIGLQRYTATAAEAYELARQLIQAADGVRSSE